MIFVTLTLAALAAAGNENSGVPGSDGFAFWAGEWDVVNRSLGPDGTWSESGRARDRVHSLFDGKLALEQWEGTNLGVEITGMSLRALDPTTDRWYSLLNWPGADIPSFALMVGEFVTPDRAEFIAGGGGRQTRYTFRDLTADSLRWESAFTTVGRDWQTTWTMDFTRRGPPLPLEELFEVPADRAVRCQRPEARQYDFLIGEWEVVEEQFDEDGETIHEEEFRLRATPLIQNCAIMELFQSLDSGRQSLHVRSFVPTGGPHWDLWTIDSETLRFQHWIGDADELGREFHPMPVGIPKPAGSPKQRQTWIQVEEDSFEWEIQESHGNEWIPRLRYYGIR